MASECLTELHLYNNTFVYQCVMLYVVMHHMVHHELLYTLISEVEQEIVEHLSVRPHLMDMVKLFLAILHLLNLVRPTTL